MINDKLIGRVYRPYRNSQYKVYISERISPTIFYCKVFIDGRFLYGVDVYESTIISNIINDVWEDITDIKNKKGE